MAGDDPLAIARRLDYVIGGTSEDPRRVLVELVQEHGAQEVAAHARVVFGSWRTRVDLVEDTLRSLLAELDGPGS